MNHFTRLLKTFDYHSVTEFMLSMAPSGKYGFTSQLLIITFSWTVVDKVFGLDQGGFVALLVIFVTELFTGIWAARVRQETISSIKLSRFSLKVACYLVMIGVSYSLYRSFIKHDENAAGWAFNWLHIALVTQVGFENTISILENVATINGKEKDAIVTKITNKFNSFFN
ncbi:phage holin family protein [Mucilaginibacter glaciei]|uniref:Phage holin family protein n=1 Tax=Mucilaginibacter glaciei TaxID=2772109 RepID=A0A926NT65_9SPHI|nr:phage holin family protein [Mucilaginibacter glaciei]MBD1394265.1 phage holin family protein [Mucilaginibacter glaciei]